MGPRGLGPKTIKLLKSLGNAIGQLGGEVVTNSEKSIVFKSNVQNSKEIINTRCFGSSPVPLETMVLKERGLNKLC